MRTCGALHGSDLKNFYFFLWYRAAGQFWVQLSYTCSQSNIDVELMAGRPPNFGPSRDLFMTVSWHSSSGILKERFFFWHLYSADPRLPVWLGCKTVQWWLVHCKPCCLSLHRFPSSLLCSVLTLMYVFGLLSSSPPFCPLSCLELRARYPLTEHFCV